MCSTRLTYLAKRLLRLAAVRRFCRRVEGAVAVEFAMVIVPFLTLMFVTMETGLIFFAAQTLETAATDSARLVKTGQATTDPTDTNGGCYTAATFKSKLVCPRVSAMFDCNKVYVDVQKYSPTDTINNGVTYTNGVPTTNFNIGAPGDFVVVRLIYQWPIAIPLVQKYLVDPASQTRTLVGTSAFRNEPYTSTTCN